MKPIPTELRERILEDCDNGLSERKAAEKWKVGRSTIAKIKKQRRETGSIEPKKGKTGPKPKLAEHRGLLHKIVTEIPDATLEEIRGPFPVQVNIQTVHVELKKLESKHKNSSTPANSTDRTSPKNDKSGK